MLRTVKSLRMLTGAFVLIAFALAVGWLQIPLPKDLAPGYTPLATSIILFSATIEIGSATFFLLALRSFKPDLKPAYRLIAFAELSMAIIAMVSPFIVIFNLGTNVYMYMVLYLGYFSSSILVFFGMRKFAGILQLRSWATSVKLIFGLGLIAWLAHIPVPHVSNGMSEPMYDVFELIPTLPLFTYAAALYLAIRLTRKIGAGYRKPFRWVSIGLAFEFTVAAMSAVMELVGYNNSFYNGGVYILFILLGDVSLLTAAFKFNTVGQPVHAGLLRRLFGRKQKEATSPDIITYAASLVSDPTKVDSHLDKLRFITAKDHPLDATGSAVFTREEQVTLRDTYLAIEHYLTTEEKLRSFKQDELRNNISESFPNTEHTFWPQITAPRSEA